MKKLTIFLALSLFPILTGLSQTASSLAAIETNKKNLAGKNYKYKATLLTSNFSLPIVKFNRFEDEIGGAKGSVSFFNTVGAGLTIAGGEIREIRDQNGEIINQDFTPTLGFTGGFLFSSNSGTDSKNSFSPFIGVSFLDFQVGYGWELGEIPVNYKRTFYTVSYNIPIYKLRRGSFYILFSSDNIDDTLIKKGRLGSN